MQKGCRKDVSALVQLRERQALILLLRDDGYSASIYIGLISDELAQRKVQKRRLSRTSKY